MEAKQLMMDAQLLRLIRSRAARVAVGPSAVRGAGNTGVARACRNYLRALNLRQFATDDRKRFARALDRHTERLRSTLPHGARHWGIARKVLNIYLRDCLYNTFLSRHYSLGRAEALLELPLDSFTAKGVRTEQPATVPRWRGVRNVTAEISDLYQDAASRIAAKEGFARVHLDALWWSFERDDLVDGRRGLVT